MTKPASDHIDFDTRLKKVHRRRVANRVRCDSLTLQARRRDGGFGGIALDQIGDA